MSSARKQMLTTGPSCRPRFAFNKYLSVGYLQCDDQFRVSIVHTMKRIQYSYLCINFVLGSISMLYVTFKRRDLASASFPKQVVQHTVFFNMFLFISCAGGLGAMGTRAGTCRARHRKPGPSTLAISRQRIQDPKPILTSFPPKLHYGRAATRSHAREHHALKANRRSLAGDARRAC